MTFSVARPTKPTHLKVIAGTERPSRVNAAEPTPTRKRLAPPAHLSDEARKAWINFAGLLDGMGVLTVADAVALEMLCETYAEIRRHRAALAERESCTFETLTTSGGAKLAAAPEVAMIADADRRLRQWLSAFGLTPADRAKVSASGSTNQPANPFGKLPRA